MKAKKFLTLLCALVLTAAQMAVPMHALAWEDYENESGYGWEDEEDDWDSEDDWYDEEDWYSDSTEDRWELYGVFNPNSIKGKGLIRTEDGKYYYRGRDGELKTGFVEVDGNCYYFGADYEARTGLYHVDEDAYCADENGVLQKGWIQIVSTGEWLYAGSDYKLVTGWQKISGRWYWFGGYSGYPVMKTGFMWDDVTGTNRYYYLRPSGSMAVGWEQVYDQKTGKSYWYYFNGSGAAVVGWQKIGGKWYYFDYYDDFRMQQGWLKDGGKTYYLDSSGAMVTGKKTIDGITYTFAQSGELLSWNPFNGGTSQGNAVSYTNSDFYAKGLTSGTWYREKNGSAQYGISVTFSVKNGVLYAEERGEIAGVNLLAVVTPLTITSKNTAIGYSSNSSMGGIAGAIGSDLNKDLIVELKIQNGELYMASYGPGQAKEWEHLVTSFGNDLLNDLLGSIWY